MATALSKQSTTSWKNMAVQAQQLQDNNGNAVDMTDLIAATDSGSKLVNVTSSTLTVTAASHASKIITLNRAAGIAVTLPNATGTGKTYTFFVGTTITSNTTTITRGTSADVMSGIVSCAGGATTFQFASAANSNTITFNGSTQGGVLGTYVVLRDVGTNQWQLEIRSNCSGAGNLTPLSNT